MFGYILFIYLYVFTYIKHIILTDENTIDMNANRIVDDNKQYDNKDKGCNNNNLSISVFKIKLL